MKPLTIKGVSFGDGSPRICIPITGRTEEEILDIAGRLSGLSFDMAEWRADYFKDVFDPERVRFVMAELKDLLPGRLLLFTFRSGSEGGERPASAEDYKKVCQSAAESGLPDLLDLELFTCGEALPALIEAAHSRGTAVILSNHDFEKTPPKEELLSRLSKMEQAGCDMAKLAVMPRWPMDVLTLMEATCAASEALSCPVITMSMGPLGAVSRVSGRLTGSCLTFGTAGEASAPGQLPAGELKRILSLL